MLEGGLVTPTLWSLFISLTSASLKLNAITRMPIRLAIIFSTLCMSLYFPSLWSVCSGCHTRPASAPGLAWRGVFSHRFEC